MIPTFAVDVTNLEMTSPEGDGSKKESLSKFRLLPVHEGIATDEALPLAAFLRLFNYFYTRAVENGKM